MKTNKFEHWRLSRELSVVNVALLASGYDPGEVRPFSHDPLAGSIYSIDDEDDLARTEHPAKSFRSIFTALRSAVVNNELRAKLSYRARLKAKEIYGDDILWEGLKENEFELSYELLIEAIGERDNAFFGGTHELPRSAKLHVLREPDWYQTMVQMDEVRLWLAKKGHDSEYFPTTGVAESFQFQSYQRWSNKLKCAVHACEAVTAARPNKSLKQTLKEWVMANGAQYGLTDKEGNVSDTAAEEIAKVANWQLEGGAPRTAAASIPAEAIENYEAHSEAVSLEETDDTK